MTTTLESPTGVACPKCSSEVPSSAGECPRCGVIFDRVARHETRHARQLDAARDALGGGFSIERLAEVERLLVQQQLERLEIFTGWEVANAYTVQDQLGNVLFRVAEQSTPWMRNLLKSMRPFTMHVSAPEGRTMLMLHRPYRFYFVELEVRDADNRLLGTVRKRFSLLNRCYELFDQQDGARYEIVGPFWRPWTFEIRRNGAVVGAIRKSWSGMLREIFTDADQFGVEFPRELDVRTKAVFLGAVFLLDLMHFEDDGD